MNQYRIEQRNADAVGHRANADAVQRNADAVGHRGNADAVEQLPCTIRQKWNMESTGT